MVDGVKCAVIDGSTSEINNQFLQENQVLCSGQAERQRQYTQWRPTLPGGRLRLQFNSQIWLCQDERRVLDGIKMVGGEAVINAGTDC